MIVGDYHILRKGLRLLFEKDDRFDVVGEASDTEELFRIFEFVTPDVVLLDLILQQNTVMNMLRQLQKNFPRIPVVVLAINASEGLVLDAVMLGVKGVIWKDNSIENLLDAIITVCGGQNYFEQLNQKLSEEQGRRTKHNGELQLPKLSLRERQVLSLIAQGLSFKEIGEKLFISPRTVESHKNNLLAKLDLNNLIELVKYAMRTKLID